MRLLKCRSQMLFWFHAPHLGMAYLFFWGLDGHGMIHWSSTYPSWIPCIPQFFFGIIPNLAVCFVDILWDIGGICWLKTAWDIGVSFWLKTAWDIGNICWLKTAWDIGDSFWLKTAWEIGVSFWLKTAWDIGDSVWLKTTLKKWWREMKQEVHTVDRVNFYHQHPQSGPVDDECWFGLHHGSHKMLSILGWWRNCLEIDGIINIKLRLVYIRIQYDTIHVYRKPVSKPQSSLHRRPHFTGIQFKSFCPAR